MELIRAAAALRAWTDAARTDGAAIGFVPTMGAMHDGHRSLLRAARGSADRVAVSIFVNPMQFDDRDDLARYPRDEPADLAICEAEGVDVVWAPPVEEVYPLGVELAHPEPGDVGDLYEGAARPGHFGGVLLVVHRLVRRRRSVRGLLRREGRPAAVPRAAHGRAGAGPGCRRSSRVRPSAHPTGSRCSSRNAALTPRTSGSRRPACSLRSPRRRSARGRGSATRTVSSP